MIISLIILLFFIFLFIIGTKGSKSWIKGINKKEHKLYFLYPMADWFMMKTGLYRILNQKTNITDSMKALYITRKPELMQKLFWCSRISGVIAVILLFDILSLLGLAADYGNSIIQNERYLQRPGYGDGNKEVDLNVILEQPQSKKSPDKEAAEAQEITIQVKERIYTKEERERLFTDAIKYLQTNVLGKNESADAIYSDLNFCSVIPDTPIKVNWNPEDYKLIQSDGVINNDNLEPDGVATSVKAVLNCQGQKREHCFTFRIMPKRISKEELLRKGLEEKIRTSDQRTSEDDLLELPDTLDKYRLRWYEKKENSSTGLLFLGIVMAAAVWLSGDKELEKKVKRRKEQMLLDYPELINKFTLLVNAGMTVKQAWNKIAEDYSSSQSKKNRKERYAYEEMLITVNELRLGIPENLAYEQYGKRIGLIPYIKFSSLISQNLKKGNKGFTELLMKEAIEAFEDRKEIAKRLGEEAGTKLLIPMMLMLIIVFLMIMIPAFWSLKI